MVCAQVPDASWLKRRISAARKKKKESVVWKYPRTFSCLVALTIASVLLLLLLAPLGQVEAATELVHAYATSTGAAVLEYGNSVIQHSIDQGFVLAGTAKLAGANGFDFMLVKTDLVGVELWTKTFGGTGTDRADSMIEHSIDTGFVLAGKTASFGVTGDDFMLVKTDAGGIEQWTKTYGGSGNDLAYSVIEHSIDTGFVIAGQTTSYGSDAEFMLVKTDSTGVEQWTKVYGGAAREFAWAVIEHSIDAGLVVAGETAGFGAGGDDMMLVKTNTVGVEQWTKTYGGTGHDKAYSVIEHSIDTGFVIAGQTTSHGASDWEVMLVKTDSLGVEMWTKTFGGTAGEHAYAVIEHSIDNGLVIAGTSSSYSANSAAMIVKTNSVGAEQWTKTFGGPSSDAANSVMEHSSDNELVVAGETYSYGVGGYDMMLIVQPSDGTGTACSDVTPTEGTLSITEAAATISERTQTLTEVDRTLADVSHTAITTVVFAAPSTSPSQSASPSLSQAASSTQTATQTASQSSAASQSSTASQSSAASQSVSPSGSQTATQTASQTKAIPSASASASASPNVDDPCVDNVCALNSTCVVVGSETQYTCDCTAISTAAVRVVGPYCNTTIEGKPVSVGGGNCPGCESAFVCTDSYTSDDPESFMEGVIPLLAAAACGCANPPQALLDQFGAVQHQVQDDKSMCMEFTIYSGNPNATASDIVDILEDAPPDTFIVKSNRLADFEPCDDEVDGCNSVGSGGDDSLVPIIIGVSAFCVVLTLGIVWYCLHKRVNQQFQARGNQVAVDAQEDVTVHVDTRGSTAWKE
jgi:hypothetical protein